MVCVGKLRKVNDLLRGRSEFFRKFIRFGSVVRPEASSWRPKLLGANPSNQLREDSNLYSRYHSPLQYV